MKKLLFIAIFGCLALTWETKAQFLTGSVFAGSTSLDLVGQATASSMRLAPTNFNLSATGSFSGIIASNSLLQSLHFQTITGLSTTPISVSINNYIIFSAADNFFGHSAPGTTPPNRFDFNLSTLSEDSFNSGTGAATFSGTGTIVDVTGAFQSTPANLSVNFSSANTYTLTVEAVPEPGTMSLAAAGLLGIWASRQRKSGVV
jgi:hypothetical protein